MIYTGFRPALIILRSIDSTSGWHVYDHKHLGYNVDNNRLEFDIPNAETTGFKLRGTGDPNVFETYISMAFAEAPFKYANAR